MFERLANSLPQPTGLFQLHPDRIRDFLEELWSRGNTQWYNPPSSPLRVKPPSSVPWPGAPDSAWHHLIYAYLLENTRIREIFRRVLVEFTHGERLENPSEEGANWVRSTEALFYRHAPAFAIYAVESDIRPDAGAVRRNAYYRMFGMDLNHGTDDNQPYAYHKPAAANREFVGLFKELLRQAWIGMENYNNSSGANPTDTTAIARLAENLQNVLQTRRRDWNLYREEFYSVALMSWLRVTVSLDTPIIEALKAQAESEHDRLRKVAERVGLAAHSKAHDYFAMAEPASEILWGIEQGIYSNNNGAAALYTPGTTAEPLMRTLVDRWSSATGENLKLPQVVART